MNRIEKFIFKWIEYFFPAKECVKPCDGVQHQPRKTKIVKSKKAKPMPSKKGGKKGCK